MAVPRLLRLPEVRHLTGDGPTTIYDKAKKGLFPPPVKSTPRTSVWPENEVAAINAARIAGRSDDEIRTLVRELVAARATLPQQLAS